MIIEINLTKSFDEQTEDVRSALIAEYYGQALLEPPQVLRDQVSTSGSLHEEVMVTETTRKTTFDVFARPRIVEVKLDDCTITAEREYIEQATNWRLHSEKFILTNSQ